MESLLIKNGTVVTASEVSRADVYIEGEKVHAIGKDLASKFSPSRVIDASGCYLFPGGVDAHTHMELPFMGTFASDDFETGTLAGLHGGTTTIIDFAIQSQGKSLNDAFSKWREKADGKVVGDYALHVAVTDFNEETRKEIAGLVKKHGVTSFKAFMAYKGALMIDDKQLSGLLDETDKHGALVNIHCENGDIVETLIEHNREAGNTTPEFHALSRPPYVEAEATGRAMDIAHGGGHHLYIVHLTCEEALNRVRQATMRNQKVYIETCIQYLLLDDSCYLEENFGGAKYVMSPPIRKKSDQAALWKGLEQNLVEVVATDHCPFCMDQKRMGEKDFSKIPNGAPGIEDRMELFFSEGVGKGRISLNKFVDATATAPAKIFGLFPKKGTIAVGADADIVIFDPNKQHTITAKTRHMNCDYNAYEGWQITGKCRTTILRGTVAVEDGVAKIGKGFGKYLPRATRNQLLS